MPHRVYQTRKQARQQLEANRAAHAEHVKQITAPPADATPTKPTTGSEPVAIKTSLERTE